MRGDAEEASKLRAEVRTRDLEFERVSSELESKKELVRALRRDTDGAERLKADARSKDREIDDLKAGCSAPSARPREAAEQLATLRETAADKASEEQSELEELRSELEARKTLIKSLRSDQERVAALQASLDEKRDIIGQLEASINKHSNTIAELRRSVDTWKRKYQAVEGRQPDGHDVGEPADALRHGRARHRADREGHGRQERRHDRDRHAPLAARGSPHGRHKATARSKPQLSPRPARTAPRAALRISSSSKFSDAPWRLRPCALGSAAFAATRSLVLMFNPSYNCDCTHRHAAWKVRA